MSWIGVKEGIKTELVTAFQQSFTQAFWNSLNPSMGQINPEDVVMASYPDVQTVYPFLRVEVLINAAHWDNIGMMGGENKADVAGILGKGTFSTDIYALSAEARDKLSDGLLALLLAREGYPGYNVFDNLLGQMAEQGYPRLFLYKGTLTLGTDDEGQGVPWEPDKKIYATTLTVGFDFAFSMPIEGLSDIIREIDTQVHMQAGV